MYVWLCLCMYVRGRRSPAIAYIGAYVCMYACMYGYMYVCMYVAGQRSAFTLPHTMVRIYVWLYVCM
jgi:hypothetical protein